MHPAFLFFLGLLIGTGTVGGIWYSEYRIRHLKTQREIAARKEMAEERVMSMLDSLPEGYIVVNGAGEIERAAKLARSFGLIVDGSLRPNIAEMVRTVLVTGQTRDIEFEMVKTLQRERRARRIWVRIARVNSDLAVIFFEDQTEKRRLDETRRDFIANISHELKTPIGAITLLSQTITQVAEEPELVCNFAGKLESESERLTELVQEIIQLSRLQETDALSNPQVVSIDGVVDEALKRMEVAAKSKHITLSRGGERGLEVYGDYSLLVTAVRNLLDNAVRYSKVYSRVSVGVSSESEVISIAVVDAGQGIAQEYQDRVFERFFRGDEARSRDTGGTGLGLSIVKHVVEDHGGKVRLWSKEGRGSTFTVELPKVYQLHKHKPDELKTLSADSGSEAGGDLILLTEADK